MAKVVLFMMVSLDGYVEGPEHDLSWHTVDSEFNTFAGQQMDEMGMILFGRRTYQMMADFWPDHAGQAMDAGDAQVTARMNSLPKVVFSRSLAKAGWRNADSTVTVAHDLSEVAALKAQSNKDIFVLGSNNLATRLLEQAMLDEVRLMINPVVVGEGTTLFAGMDGAAKPQLGLKSSREFKSGNVLLSYCVIRV